MTVRLDSCTECWVLLMMSSTGNDVGAVQYVCVWGEEGECVWGGEEGECLFVQVLVFTFHSRCMGSSICYGSTPLTSCTHTYVATPSLPVVYCSTLTHPYTVLIVCDSPCTFRVKLDS